MLKEKSDIALIGIDVMGRNLALNMAEKGHQLIVSSRKQDKVDDFLKNEAKDFPIKGTTEMKTLVADLERPRKIMMMIKAGAPVDKVIDKLLPLIDEGDILIDGGNSNHEDTTRRMHDLKEKGIRYVGMGISGGEEGARHGPSIMPGGDIEAWPFIKDLFQSIAAVTAGEPCCKWVGPEGAGHFVKMVHNGIEYGDMQLISEAYHTMRELFSLSPDAIGDIFSDWNKTELDSYLIEITAHIMKVRDEDGTPLLDKILDTAGQKGTGKWTVHSALDNGLPLSLIAESVFTRFLSALKEERQQASDAFREIAPDKDIPDEKPFIEHLRKALYAAKIISYTQGFSLLRAAAMRNDWQLDYGEIALMWRGGCIIRSRFLGDIKKAFEKNPDLSSLLLDDFFKSAIVENTDSLRTVVAGAARNGIPVPAFSAGLNYLHGYTSTTLPANLIQAQRDYFGAHTYERTDKPRGSFFHTDWANSPTDED